MATMSCQERISGPPRFSIRFSPVSGAAAAAVRIAATSSSATGVCRVFPSPGTRAIPRLSIEAPATAMKPFANQKGRLSVAAGAPRSGSVEPISANQSSMKKSPRKIE